MPLALQTTSTGTIDLGPVLGDDLDALEAAATIALTSDARAAPDDDVPEDASRRGYWGDAYDDLVEAADPPGPLGSRLWLLDDAAASEPNARRAERYAAEALAWLTQGKLARSVTVACTIVGDRLELGVDIVARTGERRTITRTLGKVAA